MDAPILSKKLISGFFSLSFRRAILLAINFLTINIVLARILPVSYIGIFNIANAVLAFFAYFSDIGLAAALIQKKEEIKQEDLASTFTIQETLALVIFLIIFFLAPTFARLYNLDISGMWLIRVLGFEFFIASLKVIPSVLLERNLKFSPLVLVEVIETFVFNILLIFLSFNHFGITAFTLAALTRGFVGVIVMYGISPWRVRIGIHKSSIKSLLNFGLPFQINSILALLKDKLVALVIARMVGAVGVGYITWAQGLAFMPLEVMNIMTRITFPAFSRLQDNREQLRDLMERSMFFLSLFFYPLLFGLLAVSPSLVAYVVSTKWQPALPLIYLFSLNAFWATLSTPSTNFLNAIGKIGISLKLMVMWTALEWALSPLLTVFYGFYGVGIATAIISFTSIIPVLIVKKEINMRVIANIWQPLFSSIVMAVIVFFVAQNWVRNFGSLLSVVALGGVFYFGLMALFSREKIMENIKRLTNA